MIEGLSFHKLSGAGNDFILIDNREEKVTAAEAPELAKRLCARGMSIGADGLILIENTDTGSDFKWHFYNSDGSLAEMCGNGSRCAARYAHAMGIAGTDMVFDTIAGPIRAKVMEDTVSSQLMLPFGLVTGIKLDVDGRAIEAHFINEGVPHVVVYTGDNDLHLETMNVFDLGRKIRYHEAFAPAGANINFAEIVDKSNIRVRTYERGVENETLACGTGCVSASLIGAYLSKLTQKVTAATRSGLILNICFDMDGKSFSNVYLEGEARIVYIGGIQKGAWEYQASC